VLKTPHHLTDNGRVCFLLPAGILFNHQDKALKFQHKWLSTYTIEQVINLADMRFYLFDNAVRPTLIVRYRKEQPEKRTDYIEYITPKTELEALRAEILVISPEDRVRVRLREVLYDLKQGDAALVWKQSFWGTPRDRKLLDRLAALPRLNNSVDQLKVQKSKRKKRWLIGQGFQPEGRNDNPEKSKLSSWSKEQLFLEGKNKNIDLMVLESDCVPVGNRFKRLRRLPEQDIFLAPHVIVTKGLRVAYADFDVVFRHALQGIHGEKEDTEILMFLAAFINSALARYFLFHTSANWGTERDEIHESELLRLPFPFPEETQSPSESKEIIKEVATLMNNVKNSIKKNFLARNEIVSQAKNELLAYIYRYYDIDELEQVLIDDTINCWMPSSMPNRGTWPIPTLEKCQADERKEYLKILCDLLNSWAERSQYRITGNLIISSHIGAGIIVLERITNLESSLTYDEQESISRLDAILKRIYRFLPNEQGSISYLRNLKVFDQDKL
ncbi:MAG TPA: hypothetical protein V6D48_09070, partial [Oculatellaceae cyanobacterium]